MNQKDVILGIVVIMIAGVCYLLFGRAEEGNQVVITLNGKEYGTYDLGQERELRIESEDGYNYVQIKGGMVYIEDADCPDCYCVKQGKTNNQHKSLICLPHKLVVEVKSSKTGGKNVNDIDVIAN